MTSFWTVPALVLVKVRTTVSMSARATIFGSPPSAKTTSMPVAHTAVTAAAAVPPSECSSPAMELRSASYTIAASPAVRPA